MKPQTEVVEPAEQGPRHRWAAVNLGPDHGWSQHSIGPVAVSMKGYLFDGPRTLTGGEAAGHAARILLGHAPGSATALDDRLRQLAGHFALVVSTPSLTVATVDRIRSIPLVYGFVAGQPHIDDRGRRLRDTLRLTSEHIDQRQALAVAMSGYTVGNATLYRGLQQLRAGEALICDESGHRTVRWFVYDAWRTEPKARPEAELSELHRFMMERLANSAAGRTIAVPLSAGMDSRMIASGLKAVGYRHVKLFSYGRRGNHEAETARIIAERLGYPWTFVPFTTSGQRAMYANADHERELWQDGDTCGGVPFEQDWTAITVLRRTGWLTSDAMIVNGQSGDYITGNHAPADLIAGTTSQTPEARRDDIISRLIAKHYRLWTALATPATDSSIRDLVRQEAEQAGATFAQDEAPHGIYEMIEYQDRQAKYVVSGQRTYDALGHDWRLPLWDDEYVSFWRRAEGHLKLGQSLYRRVLEADNWGGVWKDVPVNAKTIRPRWIIPLRLLAKAAHAPLGADAWHAFERRVFGWWTDSLRLSTVVPYRRAVASRRGPRHAVSWIAERYLDQHGMALDKLTPSSHSSLAAPP